MDTPDKSLQVRWQRVNICCLYATYSNRRDEYSLLIPLCHKQLLLIVAFRGDTHTT